MTQQELFKERDKNVTATDISILVSILHGKGWVKSNRLTHLVQQHGLKWSDRKIRAIAHASKGHIISGQKGYKLTAEATRDEIEHAANWLRHQAREMNARADEIKNILTGVIANA